MSHRSALLIVLAVAVPSLAHDTAKFRITTRHDSDRVEVKSEKDQVIFEVRSPSGISHVVIERVDEIWPDVVVLRMHLSGMESFQVSSGKTTLHVAVSSSDGQVRLWKDSQEDLPLDAESPDWVPVRVIGSDGRPTNVIPFKEGYFEVTLPRKFLEDNLKSLTLKWIDFYRH